jgi:hypothetical protein
MGSVEKGIPSGVAAGIRTQSSSGVLNMRIFQRGTACGPQVSVVPHRGYTPSLDILIDGVSAGFAATLTMSAVMLVNDRFSLIPQVDLIRDLRHVIHTLTGWKTPFLLAWLIHLILGSYVFGCTFAIVADYFGGRPVIRGVLFSLAIWLVLMLTAFPLLGYGFFGLGTAFGPTKAAAAMALNIVYGLALGIAFGSVHKYENLCCPAAPDFD